MEKPRADTLKGGVTRSFTIERLGANEAERLRTIRLVDAVVGRARSEGIRKLVLDVADKSRSAIAHEHKAFTKTGVVAAQPTPREHFLEQEYALFL